MPTVREKWVEMSIREISTQCKFALLAFDNMTRKGSESTDAAYSSAHSFLSHAANVSKLLKSKDIDPPNAENVIGAMLNVDIGSPIHDRRLRNNLEHNDKELKKWLRRKGPDANIGTYNIGPKRAFPGISHITLYDPTTRTFTFVDEDFDLNLIADAVREIKDRADTWVTAQEASLRRIPTV